MLTALNNQNANDILGQTKKSVIIDIFATWCGPCMLLKPHFQALADELGDTYIFAELNVDEARDLAIQFNVTSVPTIIFIKDKKIVWRHMGYIAKDDLKARIEEYLD